MINIIILFLVIAVNMDSFFSGIIYGIKKIKVPIICRAIIAILTFIFSYLSFNIILGFKNLISIQIAKYIGALILICMGLVIIINTVKQKLKNKEIELFEIADYDRSKSISITEAIFLTFALSIDSLSMNFASALNGITSIYLPIFTAIFQFVFFSVGILIGKKVNKLLNKFDLFLFNILPGIIFIIIGTIRLI